MNPFAKPLPKINQEPSIKIPNDSQLTSDEIELLLKLLGETSFPVKHIEILYKALWKLQIQHESMIEQKK
jgi:hypothetical protein